MKEYLKTDTLNMILPKQLKKDFMIKCISNGTDMSKALRTFMEEYTYGEE